MLTTGRGSILLTNSTVSGNSAGGDGGGVLNGVYGILTLNRSVISGNTASDGPEVVNQASEIGGVHADDFNLFGLNGEAGVSGFSPGATDIIPSGPLSSILGPLADNGGPTKTHALVAGSPAVDAVGSGCPPPATDQRGFVRPADGDGDGRAECDVGAFELASQLLPTCETAQPTRGCTVNGVANRLCQGTARGDEIFGTHRDDIIFGLDGNDRINGLSGNDLLRREGQGHPARQDGPGSDLRGCRRRQPARGQRERQALRRRGQGLALRRSRGRCPRWR